MSRTARATDAILCIIAGGGRVAVFLFMMIPVAVVILMSVNPGATFPPRAISLIWYESFLMRPDFRDGLLVSVVLGLCVTAISVALGTACAFPLARSVFKGKDLLTVLFLSPLTVPQIITAVALLNLFVLTQVISYRFQVLLVAHTIVAVPYVIRVVTGSLIGFDRSIEEASLNLGANYLQTVTRITLPLIKPGMLAGAFFAFQASFSNVTVSAFLASGNVTTLPIVLFSWLRFKFDPSLAAISTLLILFTAGSLLLVERTLGLDKLTGMPTGAQSA